jgi:ribosome-binding protein aMBF1 (putative translation factor)
VVRSGLAAGRKIILLLSGYDKGKDQSVRRQDREIAKARKVMTAHAFKDYLAASRAAESPDDAALRKVFEEDIRLGLQFHDARVARGLTQRQLSEMAGVPQADISRIERGGGNPTEATLQRLARALGRRLALV